MNRRRGEVVGGRSNETPLTFEGAAAAVALGRELGAGPVPRVVVHTSAVRSAQTTRAILEGAGWEVPLICEDGLLELCQGVAEGQPRERWWTPAARGAMDADPLGFRLADGGETHREVQVRTREALGRLAAAFPGDRVLAVGHGIAMRTLAWSLLGGGHDVFMSLDLSNLDRVDVDVDASGAARLVAGRWAPISAPRVVAGAL